MPPPGNPTQPPPPPARDESLDALRGWAILGVLSTHAAYYAGKDFPGGKVALAGQYGVQLFFVVSAYTIFLTLDRARERGAPDWMAFFIRRFFRVAPMFWVGLALYAFVPGRESTYDHVHFGVLDYLVTALLQHGWLSLTINSLVPGGWSIAAEAAFYLVVPLCFRFVRSWQGALWLLLGALALDEAANSLYAAAYGRGLVGASLTVDAAVAYIYMWFPTQFPVFACGILAYFLARGTGRAPTPPRAATGVVLLAVAGVTLYTAFGFGKHGWMVEHVCYALAFVALLLGLKAWPTPLLVNPALCLLGRISYSFYVLHFAVLHLALNSLDTFLPEPWQQSLPAFLLLGALTLAGAGGASWLTFRYVEQPCVALGHRLARAWQARRRTGALSAADPAAPWRAALPKG